MIIVAQRNVRDKYVPPGTSRPAFGTGIEAKIGMLDSRTFRTAGKNEEL